MSSPSPLSPTYVGIIHTTQDALLLFECCLSGRVNHVPRRPHDRERETVIKSGQVFIYEEHSSGIKRWTDGVSWSPSRILGNFLIYRQLVRAFPSGEKKKALKKTKDCRVSKTTSNSRKNSIYGDVSTPIGSAGSYPQQMTPEQERQLIGSLTDSYDFLDDGLIKKTISVVYNDTTHHLVSYYTITDAISGRLLNPRADPKFRNVNIRPQLLTQQSFRSPIEQEEMSEQASYPRNQYNLTPQGIYGGVHLPLNISPDHPHPSHPSTSGVYNPGYGAPVTSASYENGGSVYHSAPVYTNQYAPPSGLYSVQPVQSVQQVQPPLRNDSYNAETYRPRVDVANGASSDGNRAQMPPYMPGGNRRGSTVHGSADSGISMGVERSIYAGDATYHQGQSSAFYAHSRETPQPAATPSIINYEQPKHHSMSLPHTDFTRPPSYERLPPATVFRTGLDTKEPVVWNNNVAAGHAHYHWGTPQSQQ